MPNPTRRLDALTPALARKVALSSSRRQFLGTALKGMFAVGASAAMVSSVFEGQAEAYHTFPCGPSPICARSQGGYMGSAGPCPDGRRRRYNKFECDDAAPPGCWKSGIYLCCDCCYRPAYVPLQSGHTRRGCHNCGYLTHYGCINVFRCC